jgi:lipid-A-disaccharide synthase-like uncharacterized protein
MIETIQTWLVNHINLWVLIGLFGQTMFMMRFVVQWIASEKAKKSVMPDIFWYFSLGGGLIVFILGQGLGVFIYLRNIWFIYRHKKVSNAG